MANDRSSKSVWIALLMGPVLLVSVALLGARWAKAAESSCQECAEWSKGPPGLGRTFVDHSLVAADLTTSTLTPSAPDRSPMTLVRNSELTRTLYLPVAFRCYPKPVSPFGIEIDRLNLFPAMLTNEAERLRYETEVFPDLLHAFKESGANWTRIMIRWCELEPENKDPEEYDGWGYYDSKLASVAETGAKMIVIIGANPDWAASTLDGPIDKVPIQEFTEMLTAVVSRYKDAPYYVKHWELYNEPDNVLAWGYYGQEYAEMLEAAYAVIKATDPAAQVLMGGLAYDWFTEYGGPFNRYFIDDVLEAGGEDYFDIMNFHYFTDFHSEWDEQYNYQYGKDLIAKVNYIVERLGMHGVTKPMMCTELAEHGYASDSGSLQRQANYVVQGYARGMSVGLQTMVWYALITYDEHEQGLLFDDLSPKPAYLAYQTLVSELGGATYRRDFASGDPLIEGYVLEMPCGEEKTVLWAEGPTSASFPVIDHLRLVTRSGDESIIVDGGPGDLDGDRDGQVTVGVGRRPVYIQADP